LYQQKVPDIAVEEASFDAQTYYPIAMPILGLDVGLAGVVAAVLEVPAARLLAPAVRVSYDLERPTPEAAEVPLERLWQAVAAAARAAVWQARQEIEGIGFSVTASALVLLDRQDRPLRPVWTCLDRRARQAARQVWQAVGEEFLHTTGNRPLPGMISAVCFRQQLLADPYLACQVRRYLHLNSWLVLHLTGQTAFDPVNASLSGLFTLTGDWSPRWCAYFEVDPAWLPPVCPGNTTVGSVRTAVAAELGVPPGIPVKLGGPAWVSALAAAGAQTGDLWHETDAGQWFAALTTTPRPDPGRLTCRLGPGENFLVLSYWPVGPAALDWMHQLCFREQSKNDFLTNTIMEVIHRPTAVLLTPPFLGGDWLQIEAQHGGFRELTLATDRLDLLAALVQAFIRGRDAAVAALGVGTAFRRIFLSGPGAELLAALLPGYTSPPVCFVEEAALRGTACLFGGGEAHAPTAGGC
jgi:sugar (pentulose or hexulose) kinase